MTILFLVMSHILLHDFALERQYFTPITGGKGGVGLNPNTEQERSKEERHKLGVSTAPPARLKVIFIVERNLTRLWSDKDSLP